MLKAKYHDVEFELDIVSLVVSASSHFNIFRKKGILGKLKEPITLVSSNLYALEAGTKINTPNGQFQAAPLLKPNPDGTAMPIRSGFLVTGMYDVFGQIEIVSALSRSKFSFEISYDSDPNVNKYDNLICFGSPSSNRISGETFNSLKSVLYGSFQWGSGYNSFSIEKELFNRGDEGVILFHDSPWNPDRKVLILAGLGPMGTLACCKAASKWDICAVSKKQKNASNFIAGVKYNLLDKNMMKPLVKRFVYLG